MSLSSAVVTMYEDCVAYKQQEFISQFWRVEVQDQGASMAGPEEQPPPGALLASPFTLTGRKEGLECSESPC